MTRAAAVVRLCGLAALAVLALSFTPLPNRLAERLEMPARLEPADAIVVIGNGLHSDGSLDEDSLRGLVHGIALYAQRLAPVVVVSGMRAHGFSEPEVRARLARTLGVPADALLLERTARTTGEEALRIAALLEPRRARTILLVSKPLHLRRAAALFERAGLEVFPAPSSRAAASQTSSDQRLWLLRGALVETAAHAYYRLAGLL